MSRRLAITKRVSLEGIADGWTDECFALVIPATYAEYLSFADMELEQKKQAELIAYQLDFTKSHLISGKVMTLNDAGETVLDNLLPEDIDASKDLADKLFSEIVGVSVDPKDTPTAKVTSPTLPGTTEQ